jgi:protoporphyrinogen IX oxidase
MLYEIAKSFHLIFVITWFAGLFYIVRLFIYHSEALNRPDPEKSILVNQMKLMQKRLWFGITWPSALFTGIFGFIMLFQLDFHIPGWLWPKFFLVLGLYCYHMYCHKIYTDLKNNEKVYTPLFLRYLNELATIFLVGIIFLVILKSQINYFIWLFCLSVFCVLIIYSIKKINKK